MGPDAACGDAAVGRPVLALRAGLLSLPSSNLPEAAGLLYGADPSGLICGYRFAPGAGASALTCAAAALWLESRAAPSAPPALPKHHGPDEFVWLHFSLSHANALPWLKQHATLPADFFATLGDGSHSTRVERSDESLIALINDVHFDFAFEPSDVSTLWISVERHMVITARRQPLRSVDNLRQAVKGGLTLRSSADLLENLLHAQADALVAIVRQAAERVDAIEDQMLSARTQGRRSRLGALRRLLVRLQRLLAPEPAAMLRLLQHPPAWVTALDAEGLRQSSEEFAVALRDMTTLQERIKLLQEEVAAQVNEDNNQSLFVLTVVTVLALPINIVAGLLGMNVGGVPLAQHAHGFWIVVASVLSVTGVAAWLVVRSRRRGAD